MPAKKPKKPAGAGTAATPQTPAAERPAKAKVILPKVAKDRQGGTPEGQLARDQAKKGQGHAQTFRPAPPRLPGRNG